MRHVVGVGGKVGIVLLVMVAGSAASANKDKKGHRQHVSGRDAMPKVMENASLAWGEAPPGIPAGSKVAVLAGDPTKKGEFTLRVDMPVGYEIKPHTHLMAENLTIISGELHIGHGETVDRASMQKMTAGAFISMPAGHAHYVRAASATVVQINGTGPFDIKYIDKADDPREQKKR